ncbi:MAG TPA: sporulation protein YpjB [Bacillales bacterium]|nr:sporulation protein YpjB [Bacillales bacterium]
MRLITCILFAAILILPNVTSAAEPGSIRIWDKLTDTSAQVLELTRQGKYADAKQLLTYFEKQFLKEKREKLDLSMKDLRILSTTFDNALRAVTNVSANHENRVTSVMQFHLVVDALDSDKQPLWLNTKQQLFKPFGQMKEAAKQKNDREFEFYLNQFLSKYEMIHPALNVDLPDPVIGRLESEMAYLRNNRGDFFNKPNYMEHLERIENDLQALYNGTLEDTMEPTLPWVIISIGGIIVLTLFYSGWQKYRAEKRARNRKRRVKKHSDF